MYDPFQAKFTRVMVVLGKSQSVTTACSKRPQPCRILAVFGQVKKAISSQIANKMAISAQAAIGLRRVMTWRTYMYIIITKYQLK